MVAAVTQDLWFQVIYGNLTPWVLSPVLTGNRLLSGLSMKSTLTAGGTATDMQGSRTLIVTLIQ